MTSMILLLAVAHAAPASGVLAIDHPRSVRVAAAGGHVAHASGFVAETGARDPETAARAFLGKYEADLGIAGPGLELMGSPLPGTAGPVKFERRIGGFAPLWGGGHTS